MAETRLTTRAEEASAPVRCQLVVIDGPDMGRAIAVDGAVTVGTDEGCTLRLRDNRVSGVHLRLVADGAGHFVVTDNESSNGTYFEGSRVQQLSVEPGATLKLGHTFLRLQPQPRPLDVRPSQARRFGELVAESLSMREVFAVLELAAQSDATVLLIGETGTGKELVARALHEASGRRTKPFVAVDCGSLPESLIESELFGHVKGAFTGAAAERKGAFVRAHGGTLFLDELGAVSPAVQARLLRVLEERTVKPVGADAERAVDVRVVAATPVDLTTRVADGRFRPDLYFRLSVISVELPPLRSRREDLKVLIAALLERRGFDLGEIRGAGFDRLMAHRWPGNVRELRNVIERAVALSPAATSFETLNLSLDAVAGQSEAAVRTDLPWKDAREAVLEVFEKKYLTDLQARHSGNLSAAAREAGVDRKHWRDLLKKHGLWAGEE